MEAEEGHGRPEEGLGEEVEHDHSHVRLAARIVKAPTQNTNIII